jgi:hypothetical protein
VKVEVKTPERRKVNRSCTIKLDGTGSYLIILSHL